MKRTNIQIDRSRDNPPSAAGGDRKRVKLEQRSEEFLKLNQSDAAHARRIQQRRRMVAKGKNTVGYDEYTKKVPRHKRLPRCMRHPTTPDHTLDIPNKRWLGLVKAWCVGLCQNGRIRFCFISNEKDATAFYRRKALHQYDPPDLMKAFDEVAAKEPETPAKNTADTTSVQAKQLSEAMEKGLLVDVSPECATKEETGDSPTKLISPRVVESEEVDELAEWEKGRDDNDEFFLDEEDSDDDLI